MTKLSFHNGLGKIETYPIVTEFHDTDGFRFFVVGPVKRGPYDTEPLYKVIAQHSGEWRHD